MPHDVIKLYLQEQRRIIDDFPIDDVARAADMLWKTYKGDKTVYAFANGGGAGLIGNLVCDLANHPFVGEDKSKPYPNDLRRLKIRNLSLDPSVITGISNDLGYEEIFARPLQAEVVAGDTVFGVSGSGNSKNVLRAFEVSKSYDARNILVSRGTGGKAKALADVSIIIPGTSKYPGQTGPNDNNFHFEDSLVSISHMITGIFCQRVREEYEHSSYDKR